MIVRIDSQQDIIPVNKELKELIIACVNECFTQENIEADIEVNLLLTTNIKIRTLNKKYRNIDRETDVLTFPLADMNKGELLNTEGDVDIDTGRIIMGDVVISMEKTAEQANEYGHSLHRELAFLVTHGAYHLLGYDHKEVDTVMFDKQELVLEKLGLKR